MKLRTIKELQQATSTLNDESFPISALYHALVHHNVSPFDGKTPVLAKRFLGTKYFPLLPMEKDGKNYNFDIQGAVKVVGKTLKDHKALDLKALLQIEGNITFEEFHTKLAAYFKGIDSEKQDKKDAEKAKEQEAFKLFKGTKSEFDQLNKQADTLIKMLEMADVAKLDDEELLSKIISNLDNINAQLGGGVAEPMTSGK